MAEVLIVDDDLTLANVILDVLRAHNQSGLAVASVEDALAAVAEDRNIAILLTDLRLSGNVDGIQLIRKARSMNSTLRCILMSGDTRSVNVGKDDFEVLSKPLRMQALVDVLVAGKRLA